MVPVPPNIEAYQLTVIVSMIVVVALKIIGMYYASKAKYPDITFNYGYLVSGLMAVFIGYGSYMTLIPYEGTYIETFMGAGLFALSSNLLIDFAGKATADPKPPAPDPLYPPK